MGDIANLRPVREGESSPALKHGSYSLIALAPRAREIAEHLNEILPSVVRIPTFGPAVELASLALARAEFAQTALAIAQRKYLERVVADEKVSKPERDELERLSRDFSRWLGNANRQLDVLGLNPRSAAALGLDLSLAKGAALRAHLAERHAEEHA